MSNNEEDRREGSDDGGSDGNQSRRDAKRDERRPGEGVIAGDRARDGDDERREGPRSEQRRDGRTSDERRENEKSERGRAPERRAGRNGRSANRRRGSDRDGEDRYRRSGQRGRRSRGPGEPPGSTSRSREVPGLRDRRRDDRGRSDRDSTGDDAERRFLTVRLGRPARSVRNRERGRRTLPREVDQTSAEREYPPWLDAPDEDGETEGQRDERELWEAPLERARPDAPAEGPGSRHRQPRIQPERLVTRQPPDPRLGPPPRPQDGQPRQRPGGEGQPQDGQPVDQPGGGQNRPQQGPGLDPRYQIGQWVRTVDLRPRVDLPPRLRPHTSQGESTDSSEENRRYLEPQEVNPNRQTGLRHEQWEYSESRPDRPSERWETPDGGHEPGNDERERDSDLPEVASDVEVRRLRGPDDRDDQRRRDRRRRWRESTN